VLVWPEQSTREGALDAERCKRCAARCAKPVQEFLEGLVTRGTANR
jgi:hypothetical protein